MAMGGDVIRVLKYLPCEGTHERALAIDKARIQDVLRQFVESTRGGQCFLVGEVGLERGLSDARMLCELIHGQRIVADGIHHFSRGTHNRATPLHPLAGTESDIIFFTHG